MKKVILSFIVFSFFILNVEANEDMFKGFEWYDLIETVEVNRENPNAYFIPYHNNETALENEKSVFTKDIYKSKYIKSLNGEWNFYFVDNPSKMLSWDDKENWDYSNWDKINVPSNIQLQFDKNGFKYDKPIYINQIYPWINYEELKLSEYPVAPTKVNGVSHFKKTFVLDEHFDDREVFINFDGISSAFYLFVNGVKVGYSEDSYTTHKFNITKYLKKDKNNKFSNVENTIAIQLYRFSDGSYLENQDMIRLNGIFRDVYLISKNKVEIRDIFIKPEVDNETHLTLEASIRNLSMENGGKYNLKAYLYDFNDNLINDEIDIEYNLEKPTFDIKDKGSEKSQKIKLTDIKLWSAETPYLYRILLNLTDENGNIVEIACLRFGFRSIKIKNIENNKQQMVLNDKPILIKGVNRHEMDYIKGSALTKEDIINDLKIIKQNNINAIRTSHYPNNVVTFEVADEIGLYIMDEVNIESHYGAFVDDIPSYYPSFKNSVMDRTMNMVERDKNYTSIIMYSLGNESTYKEYPLDDKYNFYSSTKWILNRDPSRLRFYERDNRYGDTRDTSMVDVYSSQYYSIEEINKHLKSDNKLPYIQSEYAHSMGNALGNLKEYWDIFRENDSAQGGFIWDFKDQAIELPVSLNNFNLKSDNKFFAYGGDFGDLKNDLEFSGNGLLFADGTLSPKMYEVNKVYQSINFKHIKNNTFEVDNEYLFTDSKDFIIKYAIYSDNKIVKEEQLNIDLDAGSKKTFEIDLPNEYDGLNLFVNFYVLLKNDTNYGLSKNSVISYEQILISNKEQIEYKTNSNFSDITEDENIIKLKGKSLYGDFEIVFNKKSNLIERYLLNNNIVFENGPYLNYTRAQISNDTQFEFIPNIQSKYADELENTMDNFVVKNSTIKINDNCIKIKLLGDIIDAGKVELIYYIYADGVIKVENAYNPSDKLSGIIPKVGMEMILPNSFDNVKYYGDGPFENYPDRNTASIKSVYSDYVTNMFTEKYLKPQESGNRGNVSWYTLSNKDGKGIYISGDNLDITSVLYHYRDLRNARHFYELDESENVYLNINGRVRGLGNAICKDLPLDKYVINSDEKIRYSFMIIPYLKNIDEMFYAKYK